GGGREAAPHDADAHPARRLEAPPGAPPRPRARGPRRRSVRREPVPPRGPLVRPGPRGRRRGLSLRYGRRARRQRPRPRHVLRRLRPRRVDPRGRPSGALAAPARPRMTALVRRTPLVPLPGVPGVSLKLESLQRTGSFKIRGATLKLEALDAGERKRGVVAASAGNHGLGVAAVAKALGLRAEIFVPSSAPEVKRRGIAGFGAEIVLAGPD